MFTHYTPEEVVELKFAIAYKKAIDDSDENDGRKDEETKKVVSPKPTPQKPLDLGLLSRHGFVVHFNKGAPLIKKGALTPLMFIVINGEIAVDLSNRNKLMIKGGEMYGEGALLLDKIEDVLAVATMNTAVILLTPSTIEEAIRLVPALGVKIMQYLATKSLS
jgi:CRP-like cAMP-binding protein